MTIFGMIREMIRWREASENSRGRIQVLAFAAATRRVFSEDVERSEKMQNMDRSRFAFAQKESAAGTRGEEEGEE